MLSAGAAHAAEIWEQNIGPEDPRKEAGHGTKKSSGVGKTGGGCGKRTAWPPRFPARRRRIRRGRDGLYGRPVRGSGPARGRPVEPSARRDLSALRTTLAVRVKGHAHALQSQGLDAHLLLAHSASATQRD